jgi:hypothetical protein
VRPNDDPTNYQLKATEDWQIHDTTNYLMGFRYEVESDCGPFSGNLYVSAVDIIRNDTVTIKICYTDEYAKHVDLYQVLGVVGTSGTFWLEDSDPINKQLGSSFNPSTGILNAYEAFDKNRADETYIFGYVPKPGECVSNAKRVKIIVTKNVK